MAPFHCDMRIKVVFLRHCELRTKVGISAPLRIAD